MFAVGSSPLSHRRPENHQNQQQVPSRDATKISVLWYILIFHLDVRYRYTGAEYRYLIIFKLCSVCAKKSHCAVYTLFTWLSIRWNESTVFCDSSEMDSVQAINSECLQWHRYRGWHFLRHKNIQFRGGKYSHDTKLALKISQFYVYIHVSRWRKTWQQLGHIVQWVRPENESLKFLVISGSIPLTPDVLQCVNIVSGQT